MNQILHSFFSHRCKNNMLCYGGGFVLRSSRCKKNRSIFSYSAIVFVLHCKPSDDITEFHHPRYLLYVILRQFFACVKKCSVRVKNWMLLGAPAKSGKPLTLFIWCPTKQRTLPVSSNSVFALLSKHECRFLSRELVLAHSAMLFLRHFHDRYYAPIPHYRIHNRYDNPQLGNYRP